MPLSQTHSVRTESDTNLAKWKLSHPCLLSVVLLCAILFPNQKGMGFWAAHQIISKEAPSDAYPISVSLSESKTDIQVFIPLFGSDDSKGFFLIRTKERLPQSELNFRNPMHAWLLQQDYPAPPESKIYFRTSPLLEKAKRETERIETIVRLEPEERGGTKGIFLEMPKEEAMRTYIVYDFLPMGGSFVMDGGIWLTYDLPSFADAL